MKKWLLIIPLRWFGYIAMNIATILWVYPIMRYGYKGCTEVNIPGCVGYHAGYWGVVATFYIPAALLLGGSRRMDKQK
jgi:hypothetical protein